jgi:hypothetical protein
VGRTLVLSHCNCLERAFQLKEMVLKACQFRTSSLWRPGASAPSTPTTAVSSPPIERKRCRNQRIGSGTFFGVLSLLAHGPQRAITYSST